MHPSMNRLLECATLATALLPPSKRVTEASDLIRALNESSGTITNWKSRGVSKQGAVKAEQAFGCPASWVLHGVSPTKAWPAAQHSNEGARTPHLVNDSAAAPYILDPTTILWESILINPLPSRFALVINDESMPPLRPGHRAVFRPAADATAGDTVLLRDGSGHLYIREYQFRTPDTWRAVARNPSFMPLSSDTDQLTILAVQIGHLWE